MCREINVLPIVIGSALDNLQEGQGKGTYGYVKTLLRQNLDLEIKEKMISWVSPRDVFSIQPRSPRVMG